MIDGALPYLRCPAGEQPLHLAERTLRCPDGHTFDLAKQGYANLTAGRMPHSGDTAEMIADRADFLGAGHYDFITTDLTRYAPRNGGLVLDAGVGTGHYLSGLLDAAPRATGIGVDVSKPALRRAARAHPRAAAILADLWRPLPLTYGCAAVILNVFAPRNGAEFARVLRPDGVLLVVTPAPDHLTELISEHGLIQVDPDKAARVSESLGGHFTEVESGTSRRTLELSVGEVRTLVGMTPSARHVPAASLPVRPRMITAAVTITAYRKTPVNAGARNKTPYQTR